MYLSFKNRFTGALFLTLPILLGACVPDPALISTKLDATTPILEPAPPTTAPTPGVLPQVISGWLPEYSNAVEENVARNYPELLGLAASRMTAVCPNWDRLDRGMREKFWSSLTYAIAGPESGRNRTAVYRETTMSTDSVTGLQIRSEGLLQLSYVDVVNYRYKGGDISWTDDKAMALKDYAAGVGYGNPARTILDAYANLNLGLFIMYRQLVFVNPTQSLDGALGRYWSTMRAANASFSKVKAGLRTKIPECGTP